MEGKDQLVGRFLEIIEKYYTKESAVYQNIKRSLEKMTMEELNTIDMIARMV